MLLVPKITSTSFQEVTLGHYQYTIFEKDVNGMVHVMGKLASI